MDKSEAKKIFREANAQFERGKFDAALRRLQRLNLEFPRQKHILYAAARCLEELGRAQECIALCEQLITLFQDERADIILSRLAGLENVEEPLLAHDGRRRLKREDHQLIAMMLDPTSVTPFPEARVQNRALLYGLGLTAIVLLFLLFSGAFLYFSRGAAASDSGLNPGQALVIFFATAFTANLATMYALLHLMRRLRYDTFLDNTFDVMRYACFISLLLLVPLLGWMYIPVLIRRHFRLPVGELVLFLLLQSVQAIGFSLIFGTLLFVFGRGWDLTQGVGLGG